MRMAFIGATLGLAWGAGLRGWMAILAGGASSFTWSGTFMGVLLPATLVGAALGWAEQSRRKGDETAWRWTALAPLLFIAAPALAQESFVAGLASGLGTGAIGTTLIGMLGGYAISGRGPAWASALSRTVMVALVIAAVVGAAVAPAEQQLGLAMPAGAYVLLTFLVLSGLLAWACAIPHLPAYHEHSATRSRVSARATLPALASAARSALRPDSSPTTKG